MKRGQKKVSKRNSKQQQEAKRAEGAESFYRDALTEAEQVLLPEAMEMEGLDEEIALLRLKLQQAIMERPEDLDLLIKGVSLLVRAVPTQYRLSPKAKDDLMDSVIGVLDGIGQSLGLPRDAA